MPAIDSLGPARTKVRTVRRRFLTDDLLIGAALVTFFVLLGITLTAVSVGPTPSQRVPTLIFGALLGFAMLAGALRVAQFRAQAADDRAPRTVIEQPRQPVPAQREF